jgi:hypothetical protein
MLAIAEQELVVEVALLGLMAMAVMAELDSQVKVATVILRVAAVEVMEVVQLEVMPLIVQAALAAIIV